MNSHLNYLIVQQRHSELVRRAEQDRFAAEARAARSAPSRPRHIGRLVPTRRLNAARVATAAPQPKPRPAVCVRCEP
jgi:hypothetical protein